MPELFKNTWGRHVWLTPSSFWVPSAFCFLSLFTRTGEGESSSDVKNLTELYCADRRALGEMVLLSLRLGLAHYKSAHETVPWLSSGKGTPGGNQSAIWKARAGTLAMHQPPKQWEMSFCCVYAEVSGTLLQQLNLGKAPPPLGTKWAAALDGEVLARGTDLPRCTFTMGGGVLVGGREVAVAQVSQGTQLGSWKPGDSRIKTQRYMSEILYHSWCFLFWGRCNFISTADCYKLN